MPDETTLKLPGWTRRSAELTPPMNLWARAPAMTSVDLGIFLDPANDVAYTMIGGAFGVLRAEVLGHYVPRALDAERWGVYVREAGVAWLCSRFVSRGTGSNLQEIELVLRVARAIAAHRLVLFSVRPRYAHA